MRFLFDDKAADFETLRAVGYTATGGADVGEVLAATAGLGGSDPDAWWRVWNGMAERLRAQAAQAERDGRWRTAAGCRLRASNYARTAEFFLHGDPADPRIRATSAAAVADFRSFAGLHAGHDLPVAVPIPDRRPVLDGIRISEIAIPFEGASLPGWWLTPEIVAPRPTLVGIGGFDSTAEEMFHTVAKVAVDHGWNCVLFDGPGQGRAIREQGLVFRPDYEVPVAAVVDAVLGLPGVDPARIAAIGMSQGGYFVGRAAAFEQRLAAVAAWDGVFDAAGALPHMLPQPLLDRVLAGDDAGADAGLQAAAAQSPTLRWALANGAWTYGVSSPSALIRQILRYTLADGVAERIACPVLVFDAEEDHFFAGQPDVLAAHLRAPHEVVRMAAADGAGEHCNAGSVNRFHAALFDWLDAALTTR